MKALGHTVWVVAGGHIPLQSTGHEPEYTSHDRISILNTGSLDAKIEIMIFYADRDPVGPHHLSVKAGRVRNIRFNDLIDPEPVILDTDYGAVIQSNVPVVIQFSRLDSSRAENALLGGVAFAAG